MFVVKASSAGKDQQTTSFQNKTLNLIIATTEYHFTT